MSFSNYKVDCDAVNIHKITVNGIWEVHFYSDSVKNRRRTWRGILFTYIIYLNVNCSVGFIYDSMITMECDYMFSAK